MSKENVVSTRSLIEQISRSPDSSAVPNTSLVLSEHPKRNVIQTERRYYQDGVFDKSFLERAIAAQDEKYERLVAYSQEPKSEQDKEERLKTLYTFNHDGYQGKKSLQQRIDYHDEIRLILIKKLSLITSASNPHSGTISLRDSRNQVSLPNPLEEILTRFEADISSNTDAISNETKERLKLADSVDVATQYGQTMLEELCKKGGIELPKKKTKKTKKKTKKKKKNMSKEEKKKLKAKFKLEKQNLKNKIQELKKNASAYLSDSDDDSDNDSSDDSSDDNSDSDSSKSKNEKSKTITIAEDSSDDDE